MKTYKTVFNVVRKKLNIWLMTSRPCVAKFLFFPLFPLFSISCLRFLYIPACVLCHRFCPCRNEWSFKGQRGDNWILSSTFSFCSSRRKALVTHFNFSALLSSWCSSVTLFCLFFSLSKFLYSFPLCQTRSVCEPVCLFVCPFVYPYQFCLLLSH